MHKPIVKTQFQPGPFLCCFAALWLLAFHCLGGTLDADRLAWYKFNETSGTTAANSAGPAAAATLAGAPATPVWNSGSLSFDGVDDYVQTPVINGSTRTLAAWIYPKSSDPVGGSIESVFDCDVPGNYGSGWGLNNKYIYVILDNQVWNTGILVTLNQWQHVCLTFDATQARVYQNGVLKGTLGYTQGAVTTSVTYKIGRSNANSLFFHGDVRDAKIYSRAVTDLEVLTIQSAEAPAPDTAPTGLTAVGSTACVSLSWQAPNDGEAWYTVRRSLAPGGPYSILASNVVGTGFADTTVTNGTPCYYVVAAANLQGTGPDSSQASATPQPATTYYVDPAGNDTNNGTSEATPWRSIAKVNATTFKPGDQILFKRGGTWTGTLSPQGSGSSVAQITLGSYGAGAKPLIDGAGGGAAIGISGQSYWTIDGFEVTNQAGGAGGNRCGIRVGGGGDGSTIRKIRILNNDVHDIQATPNVNDGARNWGGIFVWIDEPGKADDMLIQGNTVTEIQGQGISFWAEFENAGGGMNYSNCSPNVMVRGNRVWRTSGDGILVLGSDNELVEYNEVAYAGVLSGLYNAIAAAWPTRHRDGVWQYNHVHHTKWQEANDSTAFDQDGYVFGTTYFQYNYTHNNEGGFHMEYFWDWDYGKTVSRYNLSVNDGRGTYARVYFSNRPGSLLYNNVFYNPGMQLDVSNGGADTTFFYNNIFVGASRTASFDSQGVFYNNHFFGGVTATDTANGNVTQDPKFVDPNIIHNLTGFILQSSSPCRNAGQVMAGNGGKDFWGTALPTTAPHRGASQINNSSGYTSTPSYVKVSGPFSVVVPFSGGGAATFTANVHDQNFRPMIAPPVTWSLSPAVAGCSINSGGVVTIAAAAAGQRFAVTATSGAATHTFSFSTVAPVWTNSAGTGIWNTTDANWSGLTWADGGDAVFAHTSAAQTVTLSGARSAASVKIGNGTNNANYTFTGGSGNSLTATSFTVQGAGANDPGLGSAVLNNLALTTSGDLRVGRWDVIISGNSVVNIGGQLRSTADGNGPGDWGRVTLQDNANVTATGGVNSSGSVWGLTLNGGILTTPGIRAAENSYSAGSRLTFNGTTVVATQNNAGFITVDATSRAYVGSGGAKFDTDGHDIGISIALQGGGGLTKSGLGTLTLSGNNSYTGATTINDGTLLVQGPLSSGSHAIAAGAVFELNRASSIDYTSGTTFTGTGTLRKTGAGEAVWGAPAVTFSLSSGALIDVRAGTLIGGSYGNENWTNNQSDLNVEAGAIFKTVEANVRLNRITGGGTLGTGYAGAGYQNLTIGLGGGSSTFAGSITNTDNNPSFVGNVVKEGAGTIILSGANTYTGPTAVNAGKLLIHGTQTAATGAITVAANATLGGNGSVGGAVTVQANGTLAPGASVGTFTVPSAAISGTLAIELDGSSADRLNATGNLNITNATLALTGILTGPEVIIASFGSLTGSAFATVTGLPSGYQVTYDLTNKQVKLAAVSTGFSGWVGTAGVSNPAANADPDNDGIPNALEYVLGGNPSLPDSGPAPKASIFAGNLFFTFDRVDASETSDISLVVEAGSDLATWPETYTISPGVPSVGVSIQENGTAPDSITVSIPQNAAKFARLRVIVSP